MKITKELFHKIISEYQEWNKRLNKVDKALGMVTLDLDWVSYGGQIFDDFLNFTFNDNGVDTIYWWLLEKNDQSCIYNVLPDGTKEKIQCDDIDDLWELVKDSTI